MLSVRDLLADLLERQPPAKAANPAKTEHSYGFAADSGLANALRKSANVEPDARRLDVRARLMRWGWPPEQAEATAGRIAARDGDDDRATCAECQHARPGRCANHRAAALASPEVGGDLAALPQRSLGFERAPPGD